MMKKTIDQRADAYSNKLFGNKDTLPLTPDDMRVYIRIGYQKGFDAGRHEARRNASSKGADGEGESK